MRSSETAENAIALVVDDHEPVRRMLCRMLQRGGFQTREAATVGEARAFIPALPSGAVFILDWNLPDGHGGQIAVEVRKSNPAAPVVIVSSTADVLLATGTGDRWVILSKPCSFDELMAGIRLAERLVQRTGAASASASRHEIAS